MAWIYGVDQVDSYQSEIGADQRSAPTTVPRHPTECPLLLLLLLRLLQVQGAALPIKPLRTSG